MIEDFFTSTTGENELRQKIFLRTRFGNAVLEYLHGYVNLFVFGARPSENYVDLFVFGARPSENTVRCAGEMR